MNRCPCSWPRPSWTQTCSSGIAGSNQGESIDDLLEMADIAMQVAKREGGNRVRLASFDREPEAGAE